MLSPGEVSFGHVGSVVVRQARYVKVMHGYVRCVLVRLGRRGIAKKGELYDLQMERRITA